MNVLSELEGLSGEQLCSAVLRVLLIRSQDLRDRFCDRLSASSRSGPVTSGSRFSCTLEESTLDSGDRGRLDLLLETEDAVVGVENKLSAAFQKDQPRKYLKTVNDRANSLRESRRTKHRALVAVLVPEHRVPEAEKLVGGDSNFLVVRWEELLETFTAARDDLDPLAAVLVRSLGSFVRAKCDLFPGVRQQLAYVRRLFEPGGTESQRQLVRWLWGFFPDAGGRLGASKDWCGYHFTDGKEHRGWYGFVAKSLVKQGAANPAELIIATSFNVAFSEPRFRPVEVIPGFLPSIPDEEVHGWAVDFDDSWGTENKWRDVLRPLRDAYDKVRGGKSGSRA